VTQWIVLQHVAWEGPGLIAAEAAAHGISLDVRRLDRGDPVPDVSAAAGVVVLGGPMSVYALSLHPPLEAERRLLTQAIGRGVPVLGVCLGAQLLAAAMGARVYRGHADEIGPGQITLTGAGETDAVLGAAGTPVPVMHWHGDTFDLPEGAVHLARSGPYPHQAFRVGQNAWGFQFHVEVDQTLAAAWRPHLPADAVPSEGECAAIERAGRRILGAFWRQATTPTVQVRQ
jgi:GMP synthase-like glutamine amidotransferase